MKINFPLLALWLLLITKGYSQVNVQVKYKSGELHNIYLSRETDEVLSDKLISAGVLVTYDTFSKNYTISDIHQNNKYTDLNLTYTTTDKDGVKIYTNKGSYYRVADKMDSLGVLVIINKEVKILNDKTKAIFILKIINLEKL